MATICICQARKIIGDTCRCNLCKILYAYGNAHARRSREHTYIHRDYLAKLTGLLQRQKNISHHCLAVTLQRIYYGNGYVEPTKETALGTLQSS